MSILSTEKYVFSVRVLHWLMAIMIIGLIVSGLIMVDVPKSNPQHHLLFKFHKSIGISIGMLIIARVIVRIRYVAPALPSTISVLSKKLANVTHWILYALMIVIPISGYLMCTWKGPPVAWFGILLPHLFNKDDVHANIAEKVHHTSAYILLVLLCIHVGAVLFHLIKHRVNLIRRIV